MGLSVVALVIVIAVPLCAPSIRNRGHLRWVESQLFDASHPDIHTAMHASDYGLLGGNGNHCDFYASVLAYTDLDHQALRTHFENAVDDSLLVSVDVSPEELDTYETVAVVTVHDSGRSALLDPRCW